MVKTLINSQRILLAAELSMTPETHPWLVKSTKHCPKCGGTKINMFSSDQDWCLECEHTFHAGQHIKKKQLNLPDPLGPHADNVWLAPLLVYLLNKLPRAPYFERCGDEYMAVVPAYGASSEKRFGKTVTDALLQACVAASVPEICKALKEVK